ncbi:MAG TPA: type I DNA topoisomerase [Thermoanaerobaculia bacterium]|nr:type I DNA topoisomerase [Thermoanaerobaculia bacterium]
MSKNLIIVESPAKTRTLKKFLGAGYQVEASMGHIRDLVKKDMGIGADFDPHYEVLSQKKKVVSTLRAAAKKADVVYLAPDPDREGEAIAWHIAQVIGTDPARIRRVTFNEITKRAVLKALETPREIDSRKVDAQQARRILDRLMGFRLSPLLWEKIMQGLSAGRVQSVALKMVCDRQAEMDAFVPEEYWALAADLEAAEPPPFTAKLHRIDGEKAKVENGEQAAEIVQALGAGRFRVAAVEKKESKQYPGPPFITSRLQQDAARRFGFSVKRTMAIAQGLYEGKEIGDRGAVGLITYMRTDSTRVAEEALEEGRRHIAATYGEQALPDKPVRYRSKKGAQDAHEAIRPTNFDLPPEKVAQYLKPEDLKLYRLIWDRFVASQMNPAVFDVTQVDVENGRYLLRAQGKVLKSPGFLAVYQEAKDEDAAAANGDQAENGVGTAMPALVPGEELTLLELHSDQKFTQPPARFSEATLVKALEENGIGRPSTYAQILSTLTDRDYVERVEKRFAPTLLGTLVNRMLQGSFHDIINEGYTAELELELDRIEEGDLEWKEALRGFNEQLTRDLETAGQVMPNVRREGIPTGETCPECGQGEILMKSGRFGLFFGCSRYPECSYTRNPAPAEGEAETAGEEAAPAEEVPPCEKCGSPMTLRRSRYGAFYGCSNYPECKNIRKTAKEQRAEPKPTGVTCPECGKGQIQEKRSRRGKVFYSCDRFPDCKYALWDRPVLRPCPKCDHPFLVEKSTKKKGPHLLCPNEACDFEESVEAEAEAAQA